VARSEAPFPTATGLLVRVSRQALGRHRADRRQSRFHDLFATRRRGTWHACRSRLKFASAAAPSVIPAVPGPAKHSVPEALEAPEPVVGVTRSRRSPMPTSPAEWYLSQQEASLDTKFFTQKFRFDTHSDVLHQRKTILWAARPRMFRSAKCNWSRSAWAGNSTGKRSGRILTMNGLFAVTTPRNDA